jgi:hypothetical protein
MYLDTHSDAGQAVLPTSLLSDLPLAWRIGLADAAAALDQPPDPLVPGPSLTELCALARDW